MFDQGLTTKNSFISKMISLTFDICIVIIATELVKFVHGHGRLLDPPGRSTMWREGFDTPVNYDDNQLFCGGYRTHWIENKGKCGVCGDPYNGPFENQPPGKYAKGIITRRYNQGDNIRVTVDITASHRGYFEFRICSHNNVSVPVSQDCLDLNLLQAASGSGTQYYLGDQGVGKYTTYLKLPKNLTCSQCVLQWRYRTGNRWGCYNNDFSKGPCGLGYGPQEEFYACADVEIISGNTPTTTTSISESTVIPTASTTTLSSTSEPTINLSTTEATINSSTTDPLTATKTTESHISTITVTKSTTQPTNEQSTISSTKPPTITTSNTDTWPHTSSTSSTSLSTVTTTTNTASNSSSTVKTTTIKSTTFDPSIGTKTICVAAGPWKGQAAIDMWCVTNCERKFCPSSHCTCSKINALTGMIMTQQVLAYDCKSTVDLPENNEWCQHNCLEGLCPPNWCICKEAVD